MGMFKIEIVGVGGHGCDRSAKEGDAIKRCDGPDCPDCVTARYVDQMKAMGVNLTNGKEWGPGGVFECGATLTHWPTQKCGIVDDLVAGVRKRGRF